MSKLASAIRGTNTLQIKADCMPLTTITRDIKEVTKNFDYLTQYRIQVCVGTDVYIRNTNELPSAMDSSTRAIVEEVFGEFKRYYRDIECALWERDFDKARDILAEMEKQMYTF